MKVNPIVKPLDGEHVVSVEPVMRPRVEDYWHRRLNLYTGRTLSAPALTAEQEGRAGRLATHGQLVSPGVVSGMEVGVEQEKVAEQVEVWCEDGLPTGAGVVFWNEPWRWVSNNPAPFSGTRAHQSTLMSGYHQHIFMGASPTFEVNAGDVLFTYVYLDANNPPTEVMLHWNDDAGSWEHRAYWGEDRTGFGTDGTASRRYMGPLPPAGQWVRLEVAASEVGLEGRRVNGMSFSLFDGTATWDQSGKFRNIYKYSFQITSGLGLTGNGEDVVVPKNLRVAIKDVRVYAPLSVLEGTSVSPSTAESPMREGGNGNSGEGVNRKIERSEIRAALPSEQPEEVESESEKAEADAAPTRKRLEDGGREIIRRTDSAIEATSQHLEAGGQDGENGRGGGDGSSSRQLAPRTLEERRLGQPLGELIDAGRPLPQAGILVLQPIVTEMIGEFDADDQCEEDPQNYAFEDWQLVDGCRLILYAWPTEWLPLPDSNEEWRNRLAYAIFEDERANGPGQFLPWEDIGVPIGLVGFDASWNPLFVDRNAVVRAGGEAKRRSELVPYAGNPFLWQARIQQFAEQMADADSENIGIEQSATQFRYLPPAGILPKGAVELVTNKTVTGQWVRLEVPAEQVGLVGKSVSGMAFTLFDGRATWDHAGKYSDMVWFEDAPPAGAILGPSNEGWQWVSDNPKPFSGTRAHQSPNRAGLHYHWFYGASAKLQVRVDDKLVTYVYLDPVNTPSKIILWWKEESAPNTFIWHGAYWKATPETSGPNYIGPLPPAGQWAALEVPASLLGLGGKRVDGMEFVVYDGQATWDYTGIKAGSDTVWVEDALPMGARLPSGDESESWNWVSTEPTPFSGTRAHQSAIAQGVHGSSFSNATTPLQVNAGERLIAYVYVDPDNPPTEIMLQWDAGTSGGGWEHRAYWGANKIRLGTNNTNSRRYMGPLPAAVNTRVGGNLFFPESYYVEAVPAPIEQLDIAIGASASLAPFDIAVPDQVRALVPVPQTLYEPRLLVVESVDPEFQKTINDTVVERAKWLARREDVRQKISTLIRAIKGEPPVFPDPDPDRLEEESVTTAPDMFSGLLAHQSDVVAGMHQHYFQGATAKLTVAAADILVAYVYLDPSNIPSEIMLQWNDGNSWEHRAYWGEDKINFGVNGTGSRRYMGLLPPAGQWARLEVAANQVDLQDKTVSGMAFTLFDGRATWDHAGKLLTNTVWVEDAIPAAAAAEGNEPWNWVTTNPAPFSGTQSHQSVIARGMHQHFFQVAPVPLTIEAGDTLFAYVYLDPNNLPTEVMLQWNAGTGGGWEHRAYWGANNLNWGVDGTDSRRYMGPLPIAGEWVRLEVAASQVGLEGKSVNGMAFTLFDGRATWDHAGKVKDTIWVEDALPAGATPLGDNESWNWIGEADYQTEIVDGVRKATPFEQLKESLNQDPFASELSQFNSGVNQFGNDGLELFINFLEDKVNRANDAINFGFMRVHTDIYRVRQLMLGNEAATRFATSPVLAAIAKGETNLATRDQVNTFIKDKLQLDKLRLTSGTRTAMVTPRAGIRATGTTLSGSSSTLESGVRLSSAGTEALAVDSNFLAFAAGTTTSVDKQTASIGSTATGTTLLRQEASTVKAANLSVESSGQLFTTLAFNQAAIFDKQFGVTTPNDIEGLSSSAGFAHIRTTNIADRLQNSQAHEAKDSAVKTKFEVISSLIKLDISLKDLVAPGFTKDPATNKDVPANLDLQQMKEGTVNPGVIFNQPDPVPDDEAGFFADAMKILDHTIATLRLVEGRVMTYRQAIASCRKVLALLNELVSQASARLTVIGDNLAEARHDVAVSRTLLAEEKARIQAINDRRDTIITEHVSFLAFQRPRVSEALVDAPARPVNPGLVESPVPVCLGRAVSTPPELRAMLDLLREAPVKWFPNISRLLDKLDRLDVLHGTIRDAKVRATAKYPAAQLSGQVKVASGFLGQSIQKVFSAQQGVVAQYRLQTAQLDVSGFANQSWKQSSGLAKEIVSIGDVIDANNGRTDIDKEAASEIENITRVAACLYAEVGQVLPRIRLDWAERLSQYDDPINLRNLASLPRWGEIKYLDRREMQTLVDWLYQRVDAGQPEAVAMISDLVRICILLASHAPVNQIIAGLVPKPTTVKEGGRVELSVDPTKVRIGMHVLMYAGNNVVARGVVEDLSAGQVAARVVQASGQTVQLDQGARVHFAEPESFDRNPFTSGTARATSTKARGPTR